MSPQRIGEELQSNVMKCYICQSHKVRHLLNPYRGGAIFQCEKCTNAFTYPSPNVNYKKLKFCLESKAEEEELGSYAKPIVEFIRKFRKKGKLLDIGCGSGFLIEEALKYGFETSGIEPSLSAVSYCRQRSLPVKHGYLDGKCYPRESFDIIVASHVLEHVDKSNEFLSFCRKILKSNGILCLSQTNYTGTIPRILGRFWEGWVQSEHLVHFSPRGIQFLLNKAGFRLVKIKIIPLGYHLRFKLGNLSTMIGNIYYSLNYLLSKLATLPIFAGDQMYILASKSDD